MTGVDHVWDVPLYGMLLETGGGKERMTRYFTVVSSLHRTYEECLSFE